MSMVSSLRTVWLHSIISRDSMPPIEYPTHSMSCGSNSVATLRVGKLLELANVKSVWFFVPSSLYEYVTLLGKSTLTIYKVPSFVSMMA